MFNFAGYHPEDEMDLFKYLKKSLTTIVTNHPALVSDSLRRVIQPSWMPAPPPLPEGTSSASTQAARRLLLSDR